jgi:hypothetical protein
MFGLTERGDTNQIIGQRKKYRFGVEVNGGGFELRLKLPHRQRVSPNDERHLFDCAFDKL